MKLLYNRAKNTFIRFFFCISISFLLLFPVLSQEKQYMFSTINSNQGLSHNKVNVFLRDKKGFIWIGTADGLNRFDGYSFKTFTNDPEDPTSIRSNTISNLGEDYDGNLWIGAGIYLDIFNPETETITHADSIFNGKLKFELDTKWKLHKDIYGHYWFSSSFQGLYKYYVKEDSLVKLLDANNSEYFNQSYWITDMAEDTHGDIWVIDNKGLIRKINNSTNTITDSISVKSSVDNFFNIFIDRENDIWVLDKNFPTGAIFINTKIKKIEYFNSNSEKCRLNNNVVTGFEQDSDGKIWAITDHGGINIIDKNNFSVQYIRYDPLNERSIAQDVITTIYKDYEDIIWLGTFKKGFNYYHKNLYKFSHYKISSVPENTAINDIDNFVEDKYGNLWIGTNGGGLVYLDRINNRYKVFNHNPEDPNSISSDIIVGLEIDSKDNLWIGTYYGGLDKWDGKKFIHFKNDTANPYSITDNRVWDICEDSEGLLWIATLLGGVNVLDPNTNNIIEVFQWINDTTIRSKIVLTIIKSRDEKLWFATADGIRSFDKKTGKFNYYENDPENPSSLSDNFVYDVFVDSRELIWAATSNGLNVLQVSSGKIIRLFKKDGLPGNRILTILEDDNKNIWVGTSNGLSNIVINYNKEENKYNFTFINYNRFDGLQDDYFNDKAAYKTENGELIFGGGNGYNIFHPGHLITDSVEPNIVFTDFLVFNKSYSYNDKLNGRRLLEKSVPYANKVELEYSENVFTIEFSNLNYFHPERHVYQYKLENFNEDWTITYGDERKVSYTNLDPGTYIFKVRVINPDGSWNQKESHLTIIIHPPFWKTWWFKILLITLLLLVIIIIFYLRFKTLRLQKKYLEKAVLERTNQLKELNTILEERQEEITMQNEELSYHRNTLEKIVDERTRDLEKALRKAEESDRLKSAFLANMSHEVRTPMNAIIGFSNLAKDEEIETEERNEFLDIIEKNCNSLLVLINDILDLSIIEADQLSIKKNPFDIVKTFHEIHNYYSLKQNTNVTINCNIPPRLKTLLINHDETRIRQIIQNLIDNAIKFTDKGSVIFGFRIDGENLVIQVKDTGIGIKPEAQEKIFLPFNKVAEDLTRFYEGAGLGLAISKKIVEYMNGEINFTSEKDKGTEFSVVIPVEIIKKPIKIIRKKKSISKIATQNDILVAEDEPANYYLIEKILKKTNLKITWAKNGQEAIEIVKKHPKKYSIILMDIKMPVVDGIKALNAIKKINDSIPVLAVTAYAYEREKLSILKNDFAGYISKPLVPNKLIEIIEQIIGSKII